MSEKTLLGYENGAFSVEFEMSIRKFYTPRGTPLNFLSDVEVPFQV